MRHQTSASDLLPNIIYLYRLRNYRSLFEMGFPLDHPGAGGKRLADLQVKGEGLHVREALQGNRQKYKDISKGGLS